MDKENKPQELKDADPGEENPPADGAAGTNDAKDDPKGDGSKGDQGGKQEDIKDSHGQPGINKERHEKEMAAKDAKIKELEAKIDESAKTEKGREDLRAELDKVRAEMADERLTHKLEIAGCKSVKAAKALLDDYDGDVFKLKAEHPYLFEQAKQTGRAGGKPGGAPSSLDDKIDRTMGVKK